MALDEFTDRTRRTEHPAIYDVLEEVFESGYPEELVREELRSQVEEHGVDVEPDAELPKTPYVWNATPELSRKWQVMVAEYVLCDESRRDRRYQQSAARATEHLKCGAAETVKSALTRETFFEPFTLDTDLVEGTIHISAPSSELIREILEETERRLRTQPDIIERILEHHEQ